MGGNAAGPAMEATVLTGMSPVTRCTPSLASLHSADQKQIKVDKES